MQSGKYTVTDNESQLNKLSCLIKRIYKCHSAEKVDSMWLQLLQTIEANCDISGDSEKTDIPIWDSSTAVLITYADGVNSSEKSSINPLKEIIDNWHMRSNLISSIGHNVVK